MEVPSKTTHPEVSSRLYSSKTIRRLRRIHGTDLGKRKFHCVFAFVRIGAVGSPMVSKPLRYTSFNGRPLEGLG